MEKRDQYRAVTIDRLASKVGLRGKIDAKCCECVYDLYSLGSWRKQVANCTDMTCPLYEVRPAQSGVADG